MSIFPVLSLGCAGRVFLSASLVKKEWRGKLHAANSDYSYYRSNAHTHTDKHTPTHTHLGHLRQNSERALKVNYHSWKETSSHTLSAAVWMASRTSDRNISSDLMLSLDLRSYKGITAESKKVGGDKRPSFAVRYRLHQVSSGWTHIMLVYTMWECVQVLFQEEWRPGEALLDCPVMLDLTFLPVQLHTVFSVGSCSCPRLELRPAQFTLMSFMNHLKSCIFPFSVSVCSRTAILGRVSIPQMLFRVMWSLLCLHMNNDSIYYQQSSTCWHFEWFRLCISSYPNYFFLAARLGSWFFLLLNLINIQ